MKGFRLWTFILAIQVVLTTLAMAILNYAPSWSQYALTIFSMMLISTLWSISTIYRDRSWTHFRKLDRMFFLKEFLFWGVKKEIRQEHWNRQTGFLFALVMFTPVTLVGLAETLGMEIKFWMQAIVFAHYLFTGFAIASSYVGIFFYNKKHQSKWWAYLFGMIVCASFFVLNFHFQWTTVGYAEIVVALPAIAHILTTNKKQNGVK